MDGNKRPPGGGADTPEPPAKRQATEFEDFIDDEDDGWQGPPEDEVAEVELGEAGRNWMRPDPAPLNPAKDKLRE